MRLSLREYRRGAQVAAGNTILYDVGRNEARFGGGMIEGHVLVWELADGEPGEAKLTAPVELDRNEQWLMRCDRVDFPPAGVAYLHTHQGPGIRCLVKGSLRVDTGGRSAEIKPFGAWFEPGPEPVFAVASETEETAFVRVMVLPRRLLGRSSIRYVDPADAGKPKPQRYTVFVDKPIELP